jgi:hypothetical protein
MPSTATAQRRCRAQALVAPGLPRAHSHASLSQLSADSVGCRPEVGRTSRRLSTSVHLGGALHVHAPQSRRLPWAAPHSLLDRTLRGPLLGSFYPSLRRGAIT